MCMIVHLYVVLYSDHIPRTHGLTPTTSHLSFSVTSPISLLVAVPPAASQVAGEFWSPQEWLWLRQDRNGDYGRPIISMVLILFLEDICWHNELDRIVGCVCERIVNKQVDKR